MKLKYRDPTRCYLCKASLRTSNKSGFCQYCSLTEKINITTKLNERLNRYKLPALTIEITKHAVERLSERYKITDLTITAMIVLQIEKEIKMRQITENAYEIESYKSKKILFVLKDKTIVTFLSSGEAVEDSRDLL